MSHTNTTGFFGNVFATFRANLWLVIAPTVLMTSAALTYAVLKPDSWTASQGLFVRDEAGGGFDRLGRFESIDSMKASQETVLEVARSRQVILNALEEIGPPPSWKGTSEWPSTNAIEQMQENISVGAPKGAEFGRTEVIYLSVQASTRKRAQAAVLAVCDELESHLAQLRTAKAGSVIAELTEALRLAQADLDLATARLEEIEREVGRDLGELRSLNESGSGSESLRSVLNQIKTEIRQAQTNFEVNQQLESLLRRAENDPEELLATPSRLLESQPALRRLKEGLVDAQLATASLLGQMSKIHPRVVAALRAEQEVRQNLHAELSSALRGVRADLQVGELQLESLRKQQTDVKDRLDRLAGVRATYGTLVENVRQRTDIVLQARRDLADARASQSSSRSTSLLTRFDDPVTGDKPDGPGRATIAGAGVVGGLATGVGLIALLVPSGFSQGRRWSDYLNAGRRATDRLFGRRASDAGQPAESQARAANGRRAEDYPETPIVPRRRAQDHAATPAVEIRRRTNDSNTLLPDRRTPIEATRTVTERTAENRPAEDT